MDEKMTQCSSGKFYNDTTLTLVVGLDIFQKMVTFICPFPFLNIIHVKTKRDFIKTKSGLEYRSSSILRVLKLECSSRYILLWLPHSLGRMTELTLKTCIGWNVSPVGQFLSLLGPSLKRLTLVEETETYFMLHFHR